MVPDSNSKFGELLARHLRPGEELWWSKHKVEPSIAYRLALVFYAIFASIGIIALLGVVFTVGWDAFRSPSISNIFFVAPFILLAAWLPFSGMCIWSMLRAGRFHYAVSDQRVIILNSMFPNTCASFGPADLTSLHSVGDSQRGHVRLRPFRKRGESYYFTPPTLFNVDNPKQIETLIHDRLVRPFLESTRQ